MSNQTKELVTVEQKLRALFELQQIDSKIDEIKLLRGELPMEVKDIEDEIEGLNHRISKFQAEYDDFIAIISKAQFQIDNAKTLISKYEEQQMNVKNNREFEALNKEIENQRLDIGLANKSIKENTELSARKLTQLNETKQKRDARLRDLELKREELEKTIAETRIEEEELTKQSTGAAANIEERLLIAYNRIRQSYRNGLAVVKIARASCGGCFGTIPPQRQLEIGLRRKVILCEHCGRILVDSEIEKDLTEVNNEIVYTEREI
ncbi:MAG TPA: C4-type zinc ribbon domain-containing protein [Chitinophagales bacterium]|nr:C4-type zinc ribbon domain-containing protein [Chitinophagales bacterium]